MAPCCRISAAGSIRLSPWRLIFFLVVIAVIALSARSASAQSSAAACSASLSSLKAACNNDRDVLRCCSVLEDQVYSFPDCYCSFNATVLFNFATSCGFALPESLSSCLTPTSASPPPPRTAARLSPPRTPSPPPPTSLINSAPNSLRIGSTPLALLLQLLVTLLVALIAC